MSAQRRVLAAVAFAMVFPSIITWLYFVEFSSAEARDNRALQIVFGCGKIIQGLFPLVFVLWFARERLTARKPTLNGLALAGCFGLAVGAATLALWHIWLKQSPLLGNTPALVLAKLREAGLATPARYVTLALFYSLLHSLFEEYYWRWFVFGTLKRYLHVAIANGLSSVAFMAHHVILLGVYFPERFWTMALPFSLCVAVGGAVWAWIYHRSGSLYAAWLSHALIDAAIFLVGYDMLAAQPYLWDAVPTRTAP